MLQPDPKLVGPERECIRLRSVGFSQDKLSRAFAQGARTPQGLLFALYVNGLTVARTTMKIRMIVGISLATR
jgi:hypothetical protein